MPRKEPQSPHVFRRERLEQLRITLLESLSEDDVKDLGLPARFNLLCQIEKMLDKSSNLQQDAELLELQRITSEAND